MLGKYRVLLGFLLICALATAVAVRTKPDESVQQFTAKREEKVKTFPVVDFDQPELTNKELREKRHAKSKRYDKSSGQKIEEPSVSLSVKRPSDWADGLSGIPTAESDTVVVAFVKDATAYLSADRTAVYSEFRLRIDDVLKAEGPHVEIGTGLVVQRFGGIVRFRSGKTIMYETAGQGMPLPGSQYVFFLKSINNNSDFRIITAYDVTNSTVTPLDGSVADESTRSYPFDEYKGYAVPGFLNRVRQMFNN